VRHRFLGGGEEKDTGRGGSKDLYFMGKKRREPLPHRKKDSAFVPCLGRGKRKRELEIKGHLGGGWETSSRIR